MERGAPLFGKKFRLKANVFRSEFALVPLTMTYFFWKILAKNIMKVSKRRQTTICTVWAGVLVFECLGSDLSWGNLTAELPFPPCSTGCNSFQAEAG